MFQSTHPHGVRHLRIQQAATEHWFQSTHPHGVRHFLSSKSFTQIEFQSTHPHGVRPSEASAAIQRTGFNPRTRTGCDPIFGMEVANGTVSIHAPARGATLRKAQALQKLKVSIHAPARGATQISSSVTRSRMFQSTHPHGVRQTFSV